MEQFCKSPLCITTTITALAYNDREQIKETCLAWAWVSFLVISWIQ